MSASLEAVPAYIIHSYPYKNSSLMLVCLTPFGRMSVAAKSARGMKSKFKGQLQLFVPLVMNLKEGRDIYFLNHAELADCPWMLSSESMLCAFYMNELLWHLMKGGQESLGIYQDYHQSLKNLSENLVPNQVILRQFEKKLLDHLGYGVSWTHEAVTQLPIVPSRCYDFKSQQGFVDYSLSSGFKGESILAMHNDAISSEHLHDLKQIMRLQLSFYLEGKKIISRQYAMTKPRSE